MSTSNRHEMQLQRAYPSGAEEWHCPECQRSMIMHHQPDCGRLKIIVLVAGDELASHFGASGGVKLGGVEVSESEVAPLPTGKNSTLH